MNPFNPMQGSLFGQGDQFKANGISQVLAHTPETYAAWFLMTISNFPCGYEFTSETVTAVVGQPPNHPNTVGALIYSAAKAGMIKPVGKRVKAGRSIRHSNKIEIWRRT